MTWSPEVTATLGESSADGCNLKRRVLVVASDTALRARLARMLQQAGYGLELAADDRRARKFVWDGQVEAAVVVPGPAADSLALVEQWAERIPVLLLLPERSEQLVGEVGSMAGVAIESLQPLDEERILDSVARVMASPTRTEFAQDSPAIAIGDCRLDPAGRVFVHPDGREVLLTRAELSLLTAFARRPGQVLSRDQLSVAIAGHDAEPYGRSIDMHISRLRRKIEPDPKTPRLILTASGGGYKFGSAARTGRARAEASIDLDRPRSAGAAAPDAIGPAVSAPAPLDRHIDLSAGASEKRQLTVLACELLAPTGLGDSIALEEFARAVHQFHATCAAAVARMDGSMAGTSGHEVSGFFGVPRAHEDDAERAVNAAFDILAGTVERTWSSGEPIELRIGIATGLVVVSERGAIGEASTAAPRLRNIAQPNSILVAPATHRLLGRGFVCEGPGDYQLPGAPGKVTAYVVGGRRPVESRFGARPGPGLTQFVGREPELRQLVALWERARTRKGQVALICGEAGIGKSRLCEEFLERIQADPHVTIRYQCSPHHTRSPFRPIIDQIEYAAHFEQGDAPAVKLRKLATALSDAGTVSLADVDSCALLLSIPTDKTSTSTLTPQRQKDLLIAALNRHVLGLARTQPVVIELADAHWADSSTLELFSRIIASIRSAPVLVLMSFRPEFFAQWLEEPHVTMLRLDRLGREQADAMVLDIAGPNILPPGVHAQIVSKTDGVPLFVEELTKSVLESGLDRQVADRLAAAHSPPALAIPTTLLGSLTARLDRLGAAKEIAQTGAAIGRQFSYQLLAAVLPLSSAELDAGLAQLAALELIFIRGEAPYASYLFKHALVRDAAYGTLVRDKQQQLHCRIAEALEQVSPDTVETQPELLAHHLIQGGSIEKGIHYLRQAGRRTIERSANTEAIGHLTLALELVRTRPEGPQHKRAAFELEVMLTQAMIAAYGYAAPETSAALQRARAHMDTHAAPAMKLSVLYGIWACHYVRGEVDEQSGAAAEFLAEAERHDDSGAMCVAHRIVGTTYLTKGELAASLPHLELASALYEPVAHAPLQYAYGQDLGAAASCYLSWALWLLGDVERASVAAAEAMSRAEHSAHPHTLVFSIAHAQAIFDILRHRPDDMRAYADGIISLSGEHDLSHWMAFGHIVEGWAATTRIGADEGLELLRAGVAAWQKAGARLWLPLFLALEAQACNQAGRTDEALAAIERAVAMARTSGERWYLAELLRIKAGLLAASGHAADQVAQLLGESLDVARAQQARSWEQRAADELASLRRERGFNRSDRLEGDE